MNKIRYFLLFLAIPLLCSNCKKEDEEPKEPVEFRLRTLHANLEEDSVFEEGENIIFSFLVKNNTSEQMVITPMYTNGAFFRVYELTDGFDRNFGTAYEGLGGTKIGALYIPVNNYHEFKAPWVTTDNPMHYGTHWNMIGERRENYLPKGKYYSQFTFGRLYRINGELIERKSFRVEFTVK